MDFHQDRWTPNNPDATYPRLTMVRNLLIMQRNQISGSRMLKYLRLKKCADRIYFPATMDEKTLCQEFKNLCQCAESVDFHEDERRMGPGIYRRR